MPDEEMSVSPLLGYDVSLGVGLDLHESAIQLRVISSDGCQPFSLHPQTVYRCRSHHFSGSVWTRLEPFIVV